MRNPWQDVPLHAYEGHMGMEEIYQLQTLDALVGERIAAYPARSAAIWGVAGGNGLRHINAEAVDKVVGVDVNQAYLNACHARHPALRGKLVLVCADLSVPAALPYAALVIADLFIEYIGIEAFVARIQENTPEIACCTIQKNNNAAFVSTSAYMDTLEKIGGLHRDIAEGELTAAMANAGYAIALREEWPLKSGKSFIRLDYRREG